MATASSATTARRAFTAPRALAILLAAGVLVLLSGARDTETVAASAPTTTVDDGRLRAAVRLGWIVTLRDPLPSQTDAVTCVRTGAACDLVGMLAVDSAQLQAAALIHELRTAIDPASPGFAPLPADDVRRARQLVALSEQAERALGSWTTSGCGSLVDGLPVQVRAADCGARTAVVLGSIATLRSAVSAWPR